MTSEKRTREAKMVAISPLGALSKNPLRKDKFLQCLQIFLQALQKFLNALQIFGNRTPIFRHADKKNPASRITTTYRKNYYNMCRFFLWTQPQNIMGRPPPGRMPPP